MDDERIDLASGHHLAGLRDGDQAALVELLGDGSISEMIPVLPFPYGTEQADSWVRHRHPFREEHGRETTFAIRRPDGRLVGSVGVDDYPVGEQDTAVLGYWLAPAERGRGLATQAVEAFLRYAFGRLGLSEVTSCTLAINPPSRRLLERLNFHRVETRAALTTTRRGVYDTLCYRLRAADRRGGERVSSSG